MMPASDRYVEDLYNLVNRQDGETMRLEVARIALLAAQHRANQLKQQRTAKAIDARKITGLGRDTQQRAADVPSGRDGAH